MAESVKDARELFLHELGDVLYAEKHIAKLLPKMSKATKDREVAKRLDKHLKETQQHAKNVEAVFRALGAKPKAERCSGIEGIGEEQSDTPSGPPQVADLYGLGVGARIEHYEIAAYEGLITQARAMGEKQAVALLQRNLKEEQAMLRDGKTAARRLAKDAAKAAKDGASARPAARSSSRSTGGANAASRTRPSSTKSAGRSTARSGGTGRSGTSRGGTGRSGGSGRKR